MTSLRGEHDAEIRCIPTGAPGGTVLSTATAPAESGLTDATGVRSNRKKTVWQCASPCPYNLRLLFGAPRPDPKGVFASRMAFGAHLGGPPI